MPEQDILTRTTVEVDNAEALAMLERLRGALSAREAVHKIAGRAMADRLIKHFRARNQSVKRDSGWPDSNYWNAMADSVTSRHDEERARVIVQGNEKAPGSSVAWHLYGGTIRPKTSKALAIPLQPENVGINPREKWPNKKDAFVWKNPKVYAPFLATSENGELTLHYLLLKSVTKDADPTVLPDDAVIEEDMTRTVGAFLRRALRTGAQPAEGA